MSNGDQQINCVLEICCPAGSPSQIQALAAHMRAHHPQWGLQEPQADAIAQYVLENFDLAPKGSLSAFKAEIARLARL